MKNLTVLISIIGILSDSVKQIEFMWVGHSFCVCATLQLILLRNLFKISM